MVIYFKSRVGKKGKRNKVLAYCEIKAKILGIKKRSLLLARGHRKKLKDLRSWVVMKNMRDEERKRAVKFNFLFSFSVAGNELENKIKKKYYSIL